MPKPALTSKIERLTGGKIREAVIDLSIYGKALCEEFGVSRQALEIRLKRIKMKCKKSIYSNYRT